METKALNLTGIVESGSRISVPVPKRIGSRRIVWVASSGTRVSEGDPLIEFCSGDLCRCLAEKAVSLQQHEQTHPDPLTRASELKRRLEEIRELLDIGDSLTVHAPAAGVVAFPPGCEWMPGMTVGPGDIAPEIRTPGPLRVKVRLELEGADHILVGQECLIRRRGFDGVLQGKVQVVKPSDGYAWIGFDPGQEFGPVEDGLQVAVELPAFDLRANTVMLAAKTGRTGRIMLRAAAAVVLAAVILTGVRYRAQVTAFAARALGAAEEEPIPVLRLEKNPLVLEITANGEVVGMESTPVPTPVTRVGSLQLAWLIPEGSIVAAGQPMVRFDTTNLKLNLEQQTASLAQNIDNAKITTGNQQLTEKNMLIDRTQAQMDYDYSQTVMPSDETIFSKWAIIEAQVNANLAKSRIDNLAVKSGITKRINRSQQQVLNIDRTRVENEVGIINESLNAMEVNSPAAGLVIYRRDRRRDPQLGDNYQPRKVIAEIVNLEALQARIYVLEKEAGSLAAGKPVVLQLDALPGTELHGVVRSVSSVAATLERNSPVKYFTCDVIIHDAAKHIRNIKPGMALRAKVILERYDSCFIVPAGAVTMKNGESFVYVRQGNQFAARAVQLGIGKHGQMTLLGGVRDGEVIATRNPFENRKLQLPDFSKSYLRKRK